MGSAFSVTSKKTIVNMSGPTALFVLDAIKKDKVVIFSKSYCPYCTMAKEQFKKLSQDITVIEINQRNDTDEIQTILGEITGARSVPRVFINGHFVGGGTDVKQMYQDGSLEKLLQC